MSDVKDQTIALNVRLKPETSIWFIELVWFNQINETDQMNKIGWRTFFSILLDVLTRLHQQIQQVLVGLREARQTKPKG